MVLQANYSSVETLAGTLNGHVVQSKDNERAYLGRLFTAITSRILSPISIITQLTGAIFEDLGNIFSKKMLNYGEPIGRILQDLTGLLVVGLASIFNVNTLAVSAAKGLGIVNESPLAPPITEPTGV